MCFPLVNPNVRLKRSGAFTRLLFCAGSWKALENNRDQWIQADLQTAHIIESVTTLGGYVFDYTSKEYVKLYQVSYSQDGTRWEEIPKLFDGNEQPWTRKTNLLPERIVARFIRLSPYSWSNRINMRFDVTGCAVQGRMSLVRMLSFLLQLGYLAVVYYFKK